MLDLALRRRPPGTYQIQAAIAALHAGASESSETDWPQIAALYGRLIELQPNPIVALNRAVAVAMANGPEAGLALLDGLAAALDGYHLFHSAKAALAARAGDLTTATASYARAIEFTENETERTFLKRRRAALRCSTRLVLRYLVLGTRYRERQSRSLEDLAEEQLGAVLGRDS